MALETERLSAEEILSRKKLRKTPARLAVIAAFVKAQQPLGAQELAKYITAADPATVYRTVQTLLQEGVLKVVNLRHDHVDYELSDGHDHHHIVCTSCGLIENFEGCNEDKLVVSALKNSLHFKTIQEHAIELFGLCKKCAVKA